LHLPLIIIDKNSPLVRPQYTKREGWEARTKYLKK
jgi:hypothetical protein